MTIQLEAFGVNSYRDQSVGSSLRPGLMWLSPSLTNNLQLPAGSGIDEERRPTTACSEESSSQAMLHGWCAIHNGMTSPAIQVFHNTGAHTHRITGPRYNLHPSTEAHLGSSPASIAKAIYPVAHLSAQANANPRFIWNRKPKDLQAAGSKA